MEFMDNHFIAAAPLAGAVEYTDYISADPLH